MKNELRDIFLRDNEYVLDLKGWTLYSEKIDHENQKISKYYYFPTTDNKRQISVGVFYNMETPNNIHYIAWGYRDEKDCSYNSRINDNLKLDQIVSGCPIFDTKKFQVKDSYLSLKYLPIYFFLSLTFFSAGIFTLFFYGRNFMEFMRLSMSLFFLIFGFLKVVNLKNFVESFKKYDAIANKILIYSHIYPFLEIFLGVLFLFGIYLTFASILTIFILLPTTYGIIKVMQNGNLVNCACLGGFFNIPIGPITIAENLIMILMAISMLF